MLPVAIDLGIAIALVPTDDRRVRGDAGRDRRDAGLRPRCDRHQAGRLDRLRGRHGLGAGGAGRRRRAASAGCSPRTCRRAPGCRQSAALELASSLALSGGELPALDRMTLARTAQRAENGYVGVNCGLMDQFASAFGQAGHALLLDCRSAGPPGDPDGGPGPRARRVPLRLAAQAGVVRLQRAPEPVRGRRGGDRPRRSPGVTFLRDVTPEMLEAARPRLDPVVAARAEHIVHENARVLAAVAAFEAGDIDDGGPAVLREPRVDARPVRDQPARSWTRWWRSRAGVPGRDRRAADRRRVRRLHHQPRPPRRGADALREAVMRDYPARTGLTPRVFEVAASDGARRVA